MARQTAIRVSKVCFHSQIPLSAFVVFLRIPFRLHGILGRVLLSMRACTVEHESLYAHWPDIMSKSCCGNGAELSLLMEAWRVHASMYRATLHLL